MKFIDFQQGKKTYAVVAVGVVLGFCQYYGIHIPSWVDWGLTFLGLGTLRAGVQAQSVKTAAAVADLAKLILQNVTIPDPNSDTTGAKVVDAPVEVHVLPPAK